MVKPWGGTGIAAAAKTLSKDGSPPAALANRASSTGGTSRAETLAPDSSGTLAGSISPPLGAEGPRLTM
ncbi:MAG TPA: hypothetical protein DCQ64_17670 [Candidatus Rokubacteria bacterium]|nr:hypothetical protein [Candidatus Rokubacteria bacterium]